MAWIKRNLILVLSGAIAVVLLGFGVFYWLSATKRNEEISTQIESTKAEIQRLLDAQVTPTADNLKVAKQEGIKLSSFVGQAKQLFPPTPAPAEALTSQSFKSLLANTINDLNRKAQAVPSRLETNPQTGLYYFTFEAQRTALNLPPESLRPLYDRLNEVQMISQVLFDSRVHRLVGIRRAMVPGEGRPTGGANMPGGGNDYLPMGPRTNAETSMLVWPYEVTFDSFTPELAAVMEGLQKLKAGVLVKSVDIKPTEELGPARGGPRPPPGAPPVQPPPGRGGRLPPGAAQPPPANPNQLTTIINERLVRTTLRIDVVKPDSGAPTGGPGGRRGMGGPGGAP